MGNTFEINEFSKEDREAKATYGQCRAIGFKFAKQKNGKIDWLLQKRITAHLLSQANAGKFSFQKAHEAFNKKTLSKVYLRQIDEYISTQSS